MNDKAIRKILISYIETVCDEVRIYQEKNIGSSICDVMSVTDCLTGYEIKSDADNYTRLDNQIKSYDKFFDQNYIVVSSKHEKSAVNKVPEHWGVMCIKNDSIEIVRKAKKNGNISRFQQLSTLWRIELRNILMKNNLPIFADKDKNYIKSQLVKRIDDSVLGKQIAYELLKRDYSVFGAKDYTIHKESSLCEFEIVDSLSEEDATNYTLDEWIAIYRKAQEMKAEKQAICKRKTIVRAEHKILYTDIEARPGAPWISKEIISDFANYLVQGNYNRDGIDAVEYDDVTGNWNILNKNWYGNQHTRCTVELGTSRYNALYIFEATLNLRPIKIYDSGIYNESETILALEKQKLLIDEFQKWLWKSEDRIWEVEEAYNNAFSGFEHEDYDGSHLTFPEMSEDFELYDYQKDAVQKVISSPNTLLAFDVGAGKTYIMICAAMKMRQEGISRKNLFVVPNNIVGQWEKIFLSLYPNAKLLTVEPKMFKPMLREKVLAQIRDGDYDGIIMAYSCFEMIPLSDDCVIRQMRTDINNLQLAVNEYKYFELGKRQSEKERIKNLTYKFLESMNAKPIHSIAFDELEINTIFLDEAHNYKNIPIRTKIRDLTGINTKGSEKCLEMQKKIQCVQDQNGGRGAVLATGTPLCNSISDAYAMQMYLQRDKMRELKLDIFDNWVKTFAAPEQVCEIDVDTSKFRMIRRFAKFFNLRELSRMFSQIAIFHAVDDKGLPNLNGYTDVVIPKNKALTDYMLSLCERTELIREGVVDRSYDNMLKVTTDGRKAALDLQLVEENQKYDKTSKVFECANNVTKIYNKYSGCSQLVFCDYSTPKGDEFNVYEKLKELLIANGVNEKEIAFIHSYKTEARKVKLYNDVNEGKIQVLIGSTIKLGIGANVQTKLKAIHHLDVPWRPADMVQREGRILRRGNENKDIFIYRYIAKGSFDSYSWQILETKQNFISQFLSGSAYQKCVTDLEQNVLTYAEVKALALANPLMKKKAEKENELKNLMILNSKGNEAEQALQEEYSELKTEISNQIERVNATKENLDYLRPIENALKSKCETFKSTFTEELINSGNSDNTKYVYEFKIYPPKVQNEKKPYLIVERNDAKYILYVGDKTEGNVIRLKNFFKKFDKQLEQDEAKLEKLKARKADIERHEIGTEYGEQIQRCKAELEEIESKLEIL